MANIGAAASPEMRPPDDFDGHKFRWGGDRELDFTITVPAGSLKGGETVTVDISNITLNTKNGTPGLICATSNGPFQLKDDGSATATVSFFPDHLVHRIQAVPCFHLGTGPDQSLQASVSTSATGVSGLPDTYSYTTTN